MVQFANTRLKNFSWTLGLSAAALATVLLVRFAVMANRPAEEERANDAADGPPQDFVRLERMELRAAAGIEIEPVQLRPVDTTIAPLGSASFNQNKYVKVPPKADGILAKIHVDVGANVHAGDLLAIVSSQAFGDLKASYLKAIVHQEHLIWQIEKFQAAGEGIAAKNLFETKHLLEEQLTDTARIKARLSEYGVSARQIDALDETKDISIQLPVIAPRDGVIVSRQAVEGAPVTTATPLFAIADLESMWVNLHVYEIHLPYLRLGQSMTFYPDGLPDHGFDGTVTWISPEVDSQTRTIQLRAEVDNRDHALRANMFGKGELKIDHPQDRVVVPPGAVQSHNGRHVVFVQKQDDHFEVRSISLGLKSDAFWEVTSGLKPGERVATTGSFLLKSNLENPEFGKVE